MDALVQLLSGAVSLLCAGALSFIVLSRRVHEGVVIKFGLTLMVMGLLASGLLTLKGFDSLSGLWNAALILRVGLLVVIAGYAWRINQANKGKP